MRAAITIGLILIPVLLWAGIDYASRSHDRQVKALWDTEEAIVRAKEIERERMNPLYLKPAPQPAQPVKPLPGQRDASRRLAGDRLS